MEENSTQDHKRYCLGIPIPLCVQALSRKPPKVEPHDDPRGLKLLYDFGRDCGVSKHEVNHASLMFRGHPDVVIILQRPPKELEYRLGFQELVKRSRSLWAIDQLIRFATNNARNLRSSTVLYAFAFKPDEARRIPTERCHKILGQLLRLKSPRVVIRCHMDTYKDIWMRQLEVPVELPAENYQLKRKVIHLDHAISIFQTFIPSVEGGEFAHRPEYRCLLIYDFLAAFGALPGATPHPEDNKDRLRIENLCKAQDKRRYTLLEKLESEYMSSEPKQKEKLGRYIKCIDALQMKGSDLDGPIYMLRALEGRYASLKFDDAPPAILVNDVHLQADKFSRDYLRMYDALGWLTMETRTLGTLGLAAALFVWDQHFRDDLFYKQVRHLLFLRGRQQKGWFPTTGHKVPINFIEETPQLESHRSIFPDRKKSAIASSIKTTIKLISKALLGFSEVECLRCNDPRDKIDFTGTPEDFEVFDFTQADPFRQLCKEISWSITGRQHWVIEECLYEARPDQLRGAIKIWILAQRCSTLARDIITEDYLKDVIRLERPKDLTKLHGYLVELIRLVGYDLSDENSEDENAGPSSSNTSSAPFTFSSPASPIRPSASGEEDDLALLGDTSQFEEAFAASQYESIFDNGSSTSPEAMYYTLS